jgi:hypothetical protein
VEEFLVDATYKTNRAGYELYAVIANVHGAGFLISYLLLQTKHVEGDTFPYKTQQLESTFKL